MAITELQRPTKENLYSDIRTLATEIERYMLRWEQASEFMAQLDGADLTAIGVTEQAVITDLAEFRTAVNEIVAVYRGNAVTPSKDPSVVMDSIRRMLVF